MIVETKNIAISDCTEGAYLRWYYNGWHYKLFSNRYTTSEDSKVNGKQVVEKFSPISRVEKNTSRESKIYITIGETNITQNDIEIYKGLLVAETVQLFQLSQWIKLEIDRSSFLIKPTKLNKFTLEFRAEVKEILSDELTFSPINQPTEALLFEELFDNWVLSPPYNSHPLNWATIYPANADIYVEPLSPNGVKMNKIGNLTENLYLKIGIIRAVSPTQSGRFKVDIKVSEIYINNTNPISLYFSLGDKSQLINSVGEFSFTFNDVIGFNNFTLRVESIGGGTRNINVDYVKVYKIS